MTAKATQTVPPIVELMRRIDHLGKDGKNDFHKFKYRSIDALIDALGPVLRELGMYLSTEVVSYQSEQRLMKSKNGDQQAHHTIAHLRYTFHNPDGTVAAEMEGLGEGLDVEAKGAYKAASGGAKYALGQGLMIPFETDEPDTTEASRSQSGPTSAPVTSGKHLEALLAEYEVVLGEADDLKIDVPAAARDFKGWNLKQATGAINKMRGLIAEAKA